MTFKTKPYKHQLDCFERNKDKRYFAYLMEMGTGKSKILLDTLAHLYKLGKVNAALIFANKGSYTNWIESEIPVHWSDEIVSEIYLWKAGMNGSERKHFKTMNTDTMCDFKFLIMNIEALAFERSVKVATDFVKSHRTLVTIDESTTIKNPKAKRTKAAIKLGELAVARRIMTGSLVDNNPMDAYSQFDFLKRGCLGFKSYYAYRNQYAEMIDMTTKNNPRSFKVITGFKNLNDLHSRLSQYSFIIKKKECLDLPDKVYQKHYVELSTEQETAYRELSKKSITEIDGDIVSVKIVLTKLLKLHQLVCGHMKDDEGKIHRIKHNRIDALQNILNETNGQVLIWANYRQDIFDIQLHLEKQYGRDSVLTYFGDTTDSDRDFAKQVFKKGNNTKGVRFLVANPQTGGYGLTLTGATTHIYYSNNFDAEKRNQSEDRSHRIGQNEKVTYIDLITKGTIDEKILQALSAKKNLSDMIVLSNWSSLLSY